jgi:hypothetical protein
LDLACLSEFNRKESERSKRDRKKIEDAESHPGMERDEDIDAFFEEVEDIHQGV